MHENDLFMEESDDAFLKAKDEFVYDEVKGGHGKRRILSKLNQRVIGKHEMDEIFNDWN